MSVTHSGFVALLGGCRLSAVLIIVGAHAARLKRESHAAIGALR